MYIIINKHRDTNFNAIINNTENTTWLTSTTTNKKRNNSLM